MKVSVNDKLLFELTDVQKKIIKNDIRAEIFEEDMKRRLFHVINHKYEQCYKRLKDEWEPKLAERDVEYSNKISPPELANIIFAQPDYKDRSAREKEAQKVITR